MKIGSAIIDIKGLVIHGPDGIHKLELKIMKLLEVLAQNAGQVMTRQDLIEAVWGVEYGGDESLSRGISILRKALGDKRGDYKYIATISRVGYRLIAEVDPNYVAPGFGRLARTSEIPPPSPTPNLDMDKDVSKTFKALESDLDEFESDAELSPLAMKRSRPFKAIAMVCVLSLVCAAIGFGAFSMGMFKEVATLQTRMERGLEGVSYFARNDAIEQAQSEFGEILTQNPSHAAARAGLALATFREYTHLERDPALLQRAKAHAEASLREDEHLALANIAVAWAAEFEGDLDRAQMHLDRADILDRDNIFSLESRYRIYGMLDKRIEAEELINAAIKTYPNYHLFYSYRGNLNERQGRYIAAEKDLRQAMELFPDNPRVYAQLAHSLYMQNQTSEAVAVIQHGLTISETPTLYNNLATYLFFQGQYDLAVSAFEKTLDLNGDSHDYLYWANLGDAYRWSRDKSQEAIPAYRRALQLLQISLDKNPNDVNLKSRAAMFNAKLGDLDQAQSYMDSLTLTADSPAIQHYRAIVTYEILSNRKKALEALRAALVADYPLIEIFNDPELELLRQDPAYHKLLAQTQ